MREKTVIFIISLLIVADLVTGLLFNLQFGFYRVGVVLKSLIIFVTLVVYIRLIKRKSILSIYIIMGMLLFCWISGSFISTVKNDQFELGYSVVVLSRYFLFLILSCVFVVHIENESFSFKCRQVIESFFLINSLLILIGFAFNIDLFSSYNAQPDLPSSRFGYKGLIYGVNEVAGIYIFGISYLFRENFKYNENKKILLVLTCVAALLTGTKATLIALALIVPFYFVRYRIKTFVMLLIPFVLYIGSLVVNHWEYLKTEYLSFNIRVFETNSMITFLMSGRDKYIVKSFEFIDANWMFINYLTGDAFLYSETDLLDLYFFFGLGSVIYLFVYVKIFFLKDKSLDNLYTFLVLIALASTAGHIIQSAIVPIFLLLYVFSTRQGKNLQ